MLPTKIKSEDPIPDFLTNGIMIYFLGDHRFLYIQKRYEPNKRLWYQRIRKDQTPQSKVFDNINEEIDNYYVHKHKDVIKINSTDSMVATKDDNALIPSTNIWIGLLRLPITTGNLKLYYQGKYTQLRETFDNFLARYFIGLKKVFVTKTNGNLDKKEDVLVEKWFVYPDIPQNQSVFIL